MTFKLDDKNKKTICPLAWNHSFVNQDGSFQVCCSSEEFDNHIRDEDGKPIFITSGKTTDEVMNTEFMKKLRLDMLAGKTPELCKRCSWTEASKGVSRRNVELSTYTDRIEGMLETTAADGTIPSLVTTADYRLGNLCNLQCRMCNPRSTKLWIKDWNGMKPKGEQFSDEVMESYKSYDWIDSENLVKDFTMKAPKLEQIHFAGGEPLLVPQMSKILEKCIESGNAKNIVLTYNTNLTMLPKRVLELWKEFKGVKLLASIDAVGERNFYIRHPANWEQIDKNLRFIEAHHEEYKIQECMLSTTVQALNIVHLPEIYAYLSQFKFIVKAPNLINLYFPGYLQTTVLPKQLKVMAAHNLLEIQTNLQDKIEPHYRYLLDNINSTINFMMGYDGFTTKQFEQFMDFQFKFDEKKNLKIGDFCPELSPFLSPTPAGK